MWFDDLQEEYKKKNTKINYLTQFMVFMVSMFDYENLPNTIEKRFLEIYLNTYGSVVIGKIGNDLYCVPPNLSGDIDAYNLGTTAFGVCPIGEIRGIRNKDVIFGINNSLQMPTFEVIKNAELMTELDTSILNNVVNSRMHPIPIAKDNETKIASDKAIEDSHTGKPVTILSENLLSELDEHTKSIDVINLTDVDKVDRLQYLFHSKDDVVRQFYTRFGQATQGTGKMAQQTEREIDGSTSQSFIEPLDMLKNRKEMVDNLNRIFNLNVTVDFSESWRLEFERYKNYNKDKEEITNEITETNN